MVTIGIDPGLSGALAFLSGTPACLGVYDMPVKVLRERKGKTRKGNRKKDALEVDVAVLTEMLRAFALCEPAHVVLEDVWGMPGQGASQFALGDSVGAIRAAAHAAGLRVTRVSAARWSGDLGIKGQKSRKGDKTPNLALAAELFPNETRYFARKLDNGRADAALIAYWAARYLYNPMISDHI